MNSKSVNSGHLLTLLIGVLAFLVVPTETIAQDKEEGKTEKSKKWDVAEEHVPHQSVKFTTTEGTWMNLDVSPDGKEIVFDLVGDIYIMPVGGGKAKALTRGLPFDLQPRFSPDGTMISYTSDAGGGDNIWVMNRDGSGARQISKENFRLLNNAVWTPDGQHLVARKHFTSGRSLGAGEMWMFHITGGAGLQLTKRKNDQQDAGEPVVGRDGRYVYFSEDMSGGRFFEYNKDPYSQIYVIRRYDMETGELDTLISGPGGAIRPQVSPDGKYLSFVRRVRSKSVLFVHDLETGEEWPAFDGLTHDQQEAWAIFGPYNNYQWKPDSKQIVIHGLGKIWNVDVFKAGATEIPFEAEVELRVADAMQFENDPSPSEFRTKMIRDVVTSPTSTLIVFHAAGFLYSQVLPDGAPKRLTDDEHFEYAPAFSPDGKKLAYTTWDDDALSSIYIRDMATGESKKLNDKKGYYFSPKFSPDGKKIVYRRSRGNSILGFVHGKKPGLYWMPVAGGESHFITDQGNMAFFGPDGDRVYFHQRAQGGHALASVNLSGNDSRTHLTSKYANQYAVSPDFKWVAFTELFKAYVAPFPEIGQPVDLTSNSRSYPVTKVAGDAGWFLHWSGDSQTLHWTLGPQYFSRSLTDSFSFIEGGAEEIAPAAKEGLDIGPTLKTDIPDGKIAFTNARIITMKGDEVIEKGTLVVEGNRVTQVGASDQVSVPSDAKVYDLAGKTIMPGLIDSHAHLSHSGGAITPQANWNYFANLAFGVTTVHNPSTNTETVFNSAEMILSGAAIGPRVFSTGTILYGAEGDFKAVINSYEDAFSNLNRMKAVGAISVKSYNQPRRDQRQQVIKAASELGLLVVPEGGSTFFHNVNQIIDGHTTIEHNLPIAPLYNDILTLAERAKTAYNPTLVVTYGGLSGEYYWYQNTKVWENERLLTFHPRALLDARSIRRDAAEEDDYWHVEIAKALKALSDRGAKVLIGAHGQRQGIAAHWEIWMQVQGGMSNMDALRSATINGAEWMGMGKHLGSLESGKLADLIVLSANPLENIRNTESIDYVMINGRFYNAHTMDEIGNDPKKRSAFWWEKSGYSESFEWHAETNSFEDVKCGCGRH